MISTTMINETWYRIAYCSEQEAAQLLAQLEVEQPVIMDYLLHLDGHPFERPEKVFILYIGLVTWQLIKQNVNTLPQITHRDLDKVRQANYDFLKLLSTDSMADAVSATRTVLENHAEPELLLSILDTVMYEEEVDLGELYLRPEHRAAAFVHLQVVLDAFIAGYTH